MSRGRSGDRGNEFRRCIGLEDGYDNVAHVGCSGWVIKGLPWKSSGIGEVEVNDGHGKNTHTPQLYASSCTTAGTWRSG